MCTSVCVCVFVFNTQSCLTLWDPMDCSPIRFLCPWSFLDKSTGVGCHFLLQYTHTHTHTHTHVCIILSILLLFFKFILSGWILVLRYIYPFLTVVFNSLILEFDFDDEYVSDHEILTVKFKFMLKKVGRTIKPFRQDLNQIPYDYTVKVTNKFKGLTLRDCLKNYGLRLISYRRQWPKPYQRKIQKGKMASWGGLTNSWEKEMWTAKMKEKIYPTECRVSEKSKEKKDFQMNNAKK